MKLVLVMCLLLPLSAPGPVRQDAFPTSKTISLKEEGKTWYVDERAEIANTVSIANLRATQIDGRAKENVIRVSGSLELKAVTGGKVVLNNIWIELLPDAKSLYLSNCEFNGGGVRSSAKSTTSAKVFMEFTSFGAKSSCALAMNAGSLDIQGSHSIAPIIITGVPQSEKVSNKSSVSILACSESNRSLLGGLKITGIASVQVRHCELGGATTRIEDCPKIDFDGNNVLSSKLQIVHSAPGYFAATLIHNCDFRAEKLEFLTPALEGKLEKLTLERCWFRGMTEPEQITDRMIVSHDTDATTGVTISYLKISPAPLARAGKTGG